MFDKFELAMISVQQIKYILAVAKTLNFKKAADICFVSPSTLSNGISEFEKNLGVHIFERDNKKVIITKIGKEIIKRSKDIKMQIDDLDKIIFNLSLSEIIIGVNKFNNPIIDFKKDENE